MPLEDRHKITMKWSVNDVTKGARTIDEIKLLSALPKIRSTDEKHGCKNQPLFPFIPIDHTIPDILHLFLRISDVLINLLILGLRTHDAVKNTRTVNQDFKNTSNFLMRNAKFPSTRTWISNQTLLNGEI